MKTLHRDGINIGAMSGREGAKDGIDGIITPQVLALHYRYINAITRATDIHNYLSNRLCKTKIIATNPVTQWRANNGKNKVKM